MKTIGEFYYRRVLSLPQEQTKMVELPLRTGEIKIEAGLFEWKLYAGKKWVACRSEAEARYLRVLLDSEMRSVRVPLDDAYLASILPELEQIKARIEEILESELAGVLSRKLREQVRHLVYAEITSWEEFESAPTDEKE